MRKQQFAQFKFGEVVEVLWEDAQVRAEGWEDAEHKKMAPPKVSTVGHIVKVTKKAIVLAAGTPPKPSRGDETVGHSIIPLGIIYKVRRLHPA